MPNELEEWGFYRKLLEEKPLNKLKDFLWRINIIYTLETLQNNVT